MTKEQALDAVEKAIDKAYTKGQELSIHFVRQRIIAYTNWLTEQNLMICEGVDGYTFRSSMIGGKKYTAEELYEKFESEYVA